MSLDGGSLERAVAVALTLASASTASCFGPTTYSCTLGADGGGGGSPATCQLSGGGGGVCEPPGYCAFADTSCASGYRFDDSAGQGLAAQCAPCPPPSSNSTGGRILYVDVNTTAPAGNGSQVCPLRTITDALTAMSLSGGGTAVIEPGTYQASRGEKFPLLVPSSVALDGDLARGIPVIDGAGTIGGVAFAVTVGLGGQLAGVKVQDSSGTAGAIVGFAPDILPAPAAGMHGVTVVGGTMAGVYVYPSGTSSQLTIDAGSDISGSRDGVLVVPGSVLPSATRITIRSTSVHGNTNDGIDVLSSSVVVGSSSTGACSIYCNRAFGVFSSGPVVSAAGNHWNDAPPKVSATAPADVNSACLVDVAGALSRIGSCP